MLDKEQQLTQDFHETFSTDGGKRVLAKLEALSTLNKSNISSDIGRPIDVNRLVFDEGRRTMMIYISQQLNKEIGSKRKKDAIS